MIALRPIAEEDRERMRQWRNLPEVRRWMFSDHEITPQEHNRFFDSLAQRQDRRDWIIVVDHEPIGVASIYDIDPVHRNAQWAFYLARTDLRGRGIGSFIEFSILEKAFYELDLHKLNGLVLDFNQGVLKMHAGFDWTIEGTLREEKFKDGRFCDVIRIGMLRREWDALRDKHRDRLQARGIPVP